MGCTQICHKELKSANMAIPYGPAKLTSAIIFVMTIWAQQQFLQMFPAIYNMVLSFIIFSDEVRHCNFYLLGAQPRTNAAFGQGVGDIFLDNVVCSGSEVRLIDCASNPLAAHNCQHSQDAGVVCQPAISRKDSEYM